MKEQHSQETKNALMQQSILHIKEQVDNIMIKLDNTYVTIDEFAILEKRTTKIEDTIARVAWIVITTVIGAVLAMVIYIR